MQFFLPLFVYYHTYPVLISQRFYFLCHIFQWNFDFVFVSGQKLVWRRFWKMYFWRQLTFKSVCWVCSRLLLMALNLLVRCSWLHTLYPWFSLRNLRIIWSWIVWLLKIFDWTWSVCLKVFLSIDVFSFLPVFYASHLFYNFVQLLILMNEFLAHMLKLLISLFHLFL